MMTKKDTTIVFHDLLNLTSSIRNLLYLLITKKNQSVEEVEEYLQSGLTKCNQLIEEIQNFKNQLEKKQSLS